MPHNSLQLATRNNNQSTWNRLRTPPSPYMWLDLDCLEISYLDCYLFQSPCQFIFVFPWPHDLLQQGQCKVVRKRREDRQSQRWVVYLCGFVFDRAATRRLRWPWTVGSCWGSAFATSHWPRLSFTQSTSATSSTMWRCPHLTSPQTLSLPSRSGLTLFGSRLELEINQYWVKKNFPCPLKL